MSWGKLTPVAKIKPRLDGVRGSVLMVGTMHHDFIRENPYCIFSSIGALGRSVVGAQVFNCHGFRCFSHDVYIGGCCILDELPVVLAVLLLGCLHAGVLDNVIDE